MDREFFEKILRIFAEYGVDLKGHRLMPQHCKMTMENIHIQVRNGLFTENVPTDECELTIVIRMKTPKNTKKKIEEK